MLFSFATLAVSLWLGLVAVACLRRLWRAASNEGSAYSSRDYPRATGGENQRRHRDLTPEGLISLVRRSLVSISCAVINVVQAGLTPAFRWMSKIFQASAPSQDSVRQLSPTTAESANSPLRPQPPIQSGAPVLSMPPDRAVEAAQRKRVRLGVRETAEPRLESAAQRLRKNDNQPTEKVARKMSKLRKDHSEKKSQKMNTVVTNTAKKTTRTKRKISSASNSSLTSEVRV
jgi:hypothetical protein